MSNLESKGGTQSLNGLGLKNLQNRSLRTRKFKQDFNLRFGLVSADPAEALDVARATEVLVGDPVLLSPGLGFVQTDGLYSRPHLGFT